MSKRNQKCAECGTSLDAEHEPAVLVDGRHVCSRCAEVLEAAQ
jgi:ribosomal protein S27AE